MPAAMLFPTIWLLAPTRTAAALVGRNFLVAFRGLLQGVSSFLRRWL